MGIPVEKGTEEVIGHAEEVTEEVTSGRGKVLQRLELLTQGMFRQVVVSHGIQLTFRTFGILWVNCHLGYIRCRRLYLNKMNICMGRRI